MKQRKRKNPRPKNYNAYLASPEWKKTRSGVLKRDGFCCVICDSKAINVHHRHYHGTGEEKQRDLLSLCRGCHEWVHANEVDLPRSKKGTGKRGRSLRNIRKTAQAAGHPNVADPDLAGHHAQRNQVWSAA